jgi:hypothetical protein
MHLRDLMALPVGLMLFFSFLFQPVCAAPHVVHFAVTGGDHVAHELKITVECHAVGTDDVRNSCVAPGMRPAERDFSAPVTAKISFAPRGSVGIGLTNPNSPLEVQRANASAGWVIQAVSNGIGNSSGIYADSSNNMLLDARDGSGNLQIDLRTSGNSYLNGGNVGIGFSNPDCERV